MAISPVQNTHKWESAIKKATALSSLWGVTASQQKKNKFLLTTRLCEADPFLNLKIS